MILIKKPWGREELLENLCSSAPAVYFTTHADLSDSLTQAENTSASIFISTNNQSTWIENSNVGPINQPGYETTGGTTTLTDGGENIHWYLQGSIDSGSLGLDFGQLTVSQSPYNVNDQWPPSDNLYTTLVTDPNGETGAGQDIINLRATYSDNKLYTFLKPSAYDLKHNLMRNRLYLVESDNTQSIDEFSYGVSDRGASIRIPIYTTQNDWHGYLEDRRPAGNADPYRIIKHITDTCDGVTNGQKTGSIYDER